MASGPRRREAHLVSDGIILETAEYAKRTLLKDASGHDWWHVYRVWHLARRIGHEEGADLTIVQVAALLHDIADWKSHDGDTRIGPRLARQWLERLPLDEHTIEHVCEIIATMPFKGAGVPDVHRTKESKVVQDADRLDAIGAIGIARTFAFGGANGREIYDPGIQPRFHDSVDSYLASSSPTINHFHEKLLFLRDRMNTQSGKRIAEGRHRYLLDFLDRFQLEWSGEM